MILRGKVSDSSHLMGLVLTLRFDGARSRLHQHWLVYVTSNPETYLDIIAHTLIFSSFRIIWQNLNCWMSRKPARALTGEDHLNWRQLINLSILGRCHFLSPCKPTAAWSCPLLRRSISANITACFNQGGSSSGKILRRHLSISRTTSSVRPCAYLIHIHITH